MSLNELKARSNQAYQHNLYYFTSSIRWLFLSSIVGLIVGAFSSAFSWCMTTATNLRLTYSWLLFLLPVGGLVIVFMYRSMGMKHDRGTNLILRAVRSAESIPFRVAPLIFISTVITHLFGGSAGREGAALQLGGSIGNKIGSVMKVDEQDTKIMVMCGMSAAFSALFGTPMAAAIFPLEVASVGIMQYSALLPCIFSSLIASQFASTMGIAPEAFTIVSIPEFAAIPALKIILVAAICGFVSTVFCYILHTTHKEYSRLIKNQYIRIAAAGVIVVLLTLLLGTRDYNGAGIPVIERAMEGEVIWYAFLAKIVMTALTLGAGYRGGEIVPSFFVGATLGCLLGQIFGISPSLCAAVGMISLFCGATNCPLASMLIGFELFGFQGVYYILIAVAVSYSFSGYRGLYQQQEIVYSKYKARKHHVGKKK